MSRVPSNITNVAVLLAVVAGAAYCVHSNHQEDLRLKAAQRLARESAEAVVIAEIKEKISSEDALIDWQKTLAGKEGIRLSPIVSVELQQLWLGGRPILFIGNLKDIALTQDKNYKVLLQYNSRKHRFLGTDIYLEATCSPEQTSALLQLAKDRPLAAGFNADTAIVAKVQEVVRKPGDENDEFWGRGNCLRTLVLGSSLPYDWLDRVQNE